MRRLASPALLLLPLLTLGAGCDPGHSGLLLGDRDAPPDFSIDDSGLLDADLLVDYSGRLAVEGYGGTQAWTHAGGALPPGLSLDGDGFVTGVPTYLGTYAFDVQVSGDLIGTLTGEVSLTVVQGAAELQLGWERDQTTRLTDDGDRMWDPWTRLANAGEDQTEVTLLVGLYAPGPDGIGEHGEGDDLRVGDVDPAEVEVTTGAWVPVGEQELSDDPLEYAGDLTWRAGEDTGEADITLALEGFEVVASRVMVTAPDWCPLGDHPGGPGTPGFCQ